MMTSGAHQERMLSFSGKVAAGRMMSASAIVVGLWNRSTTATKSSFFSAS